MPARLALLPWLWLCGMTPASAIDEMTLAIGSIAGAGWQADEVTLAVDLLTERGTLRIARLRLPEPVGEVRELALRCTPLLVRAAMIHCAQASISLAHPLPEAVRLGGSFRYELASGSLAFAVEDLPLAGGTASVSGSLEDGHWQVSVVASSLSIGNEAGTAATEQLDLRLAAGASPRKDGWDLDVELELSSGQAYLQPVFLDLAGAPLALAFTGHWSPANGILAIDSYLLEHQGVLRARGALELATGSEDPVTSLTMTVEQASLPAAYASYLQPFLIGTPLDSLDTSGSLAGQLIYSGGALQAISLAFDKVSIDDRQERFALDELAGTIDWDSDAAQSRESRLRWQAGRVWQVPLGPAELRVTSAGRDLGLVEAVRIPVLDGALQVRRFAVTDAGGTGQRISFDGELEPLDLAALSRALGWPEFGGTLAGSAPTIEYRDGTLEVDGTLAADVFDGRIEVAGLRLEDPFGARPVLYADIVLQQLDLAALTGAFSFGRIDGRINGEIQELRLLQWWPAAFDARLYTPPDDRSRRRISQRAIENIAALGGSNAGAALSRGFLRMFDDFGYDRIALGCRLRNGICQMSGLEPHRSGGYYIVKGRLLPRVDVIGFGTEVSWDGLLEQLKAATASDGPVIQ